MTRDVAPGPGQDAQAAGKPEAELRAPKPVSPTASVVETGKAKPAEDAVVPPARSPYRGLLSDLFLAIGEKWVDRGTMYLPLPSGGDVVLQLSDFPVVRFSGGAEALIDFRGGIPPRVADAIPRNGNRSASSLSPTRAARGIGSTGSCACPGTIP